MSHPLHYRVKRIENALRGSASEEERLAQFRAFLANGTEPTNRDVKRRAVAAREAFEQLGGTFADRLFSQKNGCVGNLYRVARDEPPEAPSE